MLLAMVVLASMVGFPWTAPGTGPETGSLLGGGAERIEENATPLSDAGELSTDAESDEEQQADSLPENTEGGTDPVPEIEIQADGGTTENDVPEEEEKPQDASIISEDGPDTAEEPGIASEESDPDINTDAPADETDDTQQEEKAPYQASGLGNLKVAVEGTCTPGQEFDLEYSTSASGAAGWQVVEAWVVDGLKDSDEKLTLNGILCAVPQLSEGETLSVYPLTSSDTLGECLCERITLEESFSLELNQNTIGIVLIKVPAPEGERVFTDDEPLRAGDTLYITGLLPVGGVIDAVPAEAVEIEGEETLASYDISIYSDEEKQSELDAWQPSAESVVVHLYDESFLGLEIVNIYHTTDDGETILVASVVPEDGWITFEADGFSVYTFTTTIRKIITAGDGHSYLISVKYDENKAFPSGVDLLVRELEEESEEYDEYLMQTEDLLEAASFGYARFFDIAVVDASGTRLTPRAPVSVSIELMDADEAEEDFSVVHFGEETEIVNSESDGNTVSFETDSFSVYAVIQGPELFEAPENSVMTLAELNEHCGETGFYLSVSRGGKTYYFKNNVTRKKVIDRTGDGDITSAALWYFEKADGSGDRYYLYTKIDDRPFYLHKLPDRYVELSETEKTALTVVLYDAETEGGFSAYADSSSWLNYSNSNAGFKFWTEKNSDCRFVLTYPRSVPADPYELDGRSFGLMQYSGSTFGWGLLAEAKDSKTLRDLSLTVRTNPLSRSEKLFVASDSSIAIWTFHNVREDLYTLSAETDGTVRYLRVQEGSLTLTEDREEATSLKVIPGAGENAGKLRLTDGDRTLAHLGDNAGFGVSASAKGGEWLDLVGLSELTEEDFVIYSADKISLSDRDLVNNGALVVVYTRVWDEEDKTYQFYALDHDGTLVRCYESGEMIQWVGTRVNTMLWHFTEYEDEGTNEPTGYYELKNSYSELFLAPQLNGQILSEEPIGLNLNGRSYGDYQSSILAWDDPYYAYAGLLVENGTVETCGMAEASDFYFAVIPPSADGEELTVIPTVDHTAYGITMKLADYGNPVTISNTTTSSIQHAVIGDSTYVQWTPNYGLVSTYLEDDGYPICTLTGRSLSELFSGAIEVNHLFTGSIYSGSGYYEFDSTQNFASLKGSDFVVYKEIGTMDNSSKDSLKHGQFMPFNDLKSGVYASVNGRNLYNASQEALSDEDPRKYEKLLLVSKPNYYFGVEITANFVQTPNGCDPWGHDIIYEFTGDDDFWLYVDGELVIDLGGIHSALPGKINYCTGEVWVNGTYTTLYDVFKNNWQARNEGSSEEELNAYLGRIFTQNASGQYVFKDYSGHTMKIFYMERGAGASNLHMRFNLSSVKRGQVQLTKEISGTEQADFNLAEYPFRILYRVSRDQKEGALALSSNSAVTYKRSKTPVKYLASYTPPGSGSTYENVFFLKPGETVDINFPDNVIDYSIVECAVNPSIYRAVSANGVALTGVPDVDRLDYPIETATIDDRPQVSFVNYVRENALRTLTIEKRLYAEGYDPSAPQEAHTHLLSFDDDSTAFQYRLYLSAEDDTLKAASMQTYYVKAPDGCYCRWDKDLQRFVSLGKKSFAELSAQEKSMAAFQTSPNGAISRIPNEYSVEVRDLLVGTRFMVEERAAEIPDGYNLIGYERVGGTYLTEDGGKPNVGTIRENSDPVIAVLNRRGWSLRATKIWTDADFTSAHDDVYFAVYVDDTLLDGTVRKPDASGTVDYFFSSLQNGTSFTDYAVYEVRYADSLPGETEADAAGAVERIEPDEMIRLGADMKDGSRRDDLTYTVAYERGETYGSVPGLANIRRETVINRRLGGLTLVKTDCDGTGLAGAVFSLSRIEGEEVTQIGNFTSGADGTTAVLYLEDGTFILTEESAPRQYQAPSEPITIVLSGGEFAISGGQDGSLSYDAADDTLYVVNRPFTLKVIEVAADNAHKTLGGGHFALYREVQGVKDYYPIATLSDVVTGDNGLVIGIDETLVPGSYYLSEKQAPEGYEKPISDLRFTITPQGIVMIDEGAHGCVLQCTRSESVDYVIRVPNSATAQVGPTGFEDDGGAYALMLTAGIMLAGTLLVSFHARRRKNSR